MSGSVELLEAERRLGTTLKDKYRLDRILGVGGMAVVYAATHRNRQSFAIKMLHTQLSFVEELRVRFQREGYVANTVEHPGTVAVLDDDVGDDGAAFLVMELLEGAGVDGVVEKYGGKLPPREALGLVYQLLDVLAAAHAKGVVHRDIKPANLFLEHTGRLKVLDFGIARLRDATSSRMATGTGMQLGTPAFMAPEQALGTTAEIDAVTDLWAVGATLFTLISGRLVHEASTGPQILIYAATQPARSLAEVAPETPASVVNLVARSLAFKKSERFGSAAEMRAEVARVAAELYGGVPGEEHLAPLASGGDPALADTRVSSGVPPGSQTPLEASGSVSGTAGTELRPSGLPPSETANSVSISGIGRASTLPRGSRTTIVVVVSSAVAAAAAWLWLSRPAPHQGPADDPVIGAASGAGVPSAGEQKIPVPEPIAAESVVPPKAEPSAAPSASAAPVKGGAKQQKAPGPPRPQQRPHGASDDEAHSESAGKDTSGQHNPLDMPIQ